MAVFCRKEGTVTRATRVQGWRIVHFSIGELEMGDEALHEVLLCIRRGEIYHQLIHLGRFAELKISLCNAP